MPRSPCREAAGAPPSNHGERRVSAVSGGTRCDARRWRSIGSGYCICLFTSLFAPTIVRGQAAVLERATSGDSSGTPSGSGWIVLAVGRERVSMRELNQAFRNARNNEIRYLWSYGL
jgi:hypothetical protein